MEIGKFGSWLHTTVKRISLDYFRKDNRFGLKTMDDLKFASQVETTEDIVIRNERQTIMWDAINLLTERENRSLSCST